MPGLTAGRLELPEPRRAVRATLKDNDSRETIDDALALWFPWDQVVTMVLYATLLGAVVTIIFLIIGVKLH